MSAWDILVILIFGIMGVVALWFPLMMFATMFSGWWDLAKRFPRKPVGDNPTRGVGTVVFSPIFRYNNVVHWTTDDDFLHLSLPLIGVFHEPMSIPLAEFDFFAGDKSVLGLTPVQINRKRILVTNAMLEREAAIRKHLDADATVVNNAND